MDETIEKGDMSDEIIDSNQTILSDTIFSPPQKLTPTGKISHAKTRVYTQRYRKEWEQMADFKGWLTSVPSQPTRAFCTYCKKNLHAHRLSLLKHTCTMKHQRAALLAQNDQKNNRNDGNADELNKHSENDPDFEEVTVVSAIKSLAHEDEEMEEFEYVVESLEVEEDEAVEEVSKDNREDEVIQENDNMKLISGEEDHQSPQMKKIKLENYPRRDALAEAMAHVHGEYLDQSEEDHGSLELDMVVENDTTIIPDRIDDDGAVVIANNEENSSSQREAGENCASETGQKTKIIAYKINSPNISTVNLQAINTVTIAPNQQNKTLTLNNGKTVKLNTSKLIGGTQYVLSKVKGHVSTLVMAGSKNVSSHRPLVPKNIKTSPPHPSSIVPQPNAMIGIASTSQEQLSRSVDVSGHHKNPCISTHVLDTSKGTPVAGLQVSLYKLMDGRWTFLNESTTSGTGRCTDLINTSKCPFTAGRYKMHFDVDKYFTLRRIETLYPFIEIVFDVKNPSGNYHIPVLLSPYGYTTYRGSDR